MDRAAKTLFASFLIFFGHALPSLALAEDLPLSVEGLITEKHELRLDLSATYSNSFRKDVDAGGPVFIQTGPTSFVAVPSVIGEEASNTDVLVGTFGLRYGLSADAEVYGRGSYLYSERRSRGLSGNESRSESRFVDAWLGFNYRLSEDTETPALLGFVEGALRERHENDSVSGKSWMVGLTTYRAIDPVVLSLTAGYRWSGARDDGAVRLNPGEFLYVSPAVDFAVNDRVTLTTGVQWTSRYPERRDGVEQGFRETGTDLIVGLGYGVSAGSNLYLTFKSSTSGRGGADLRLNWLYTL